MNEPEISHVLIADDEEPARRRLADLISASGLNASIAEAVDGSSALEILKSSYVDLVFLDVQMPVMSGLEVVRAVGASRNAGDHLCYIL